ncbi:hypothetical protein B0T16DRAFT_458744 [Cercophora newfieldiana]|uniref:Peptidase C14 caspase domain-containing protein n=1 Tax=Cercophora newfieldiana TaxID=92897 RepID=A0AA39Y6B6_9PEZI|nr:hypothetical protein B0T16DRAFT_458744 [Cercophora newfieldiana]
MQRFDTRRREVDYEYGPEGAWGAAPTTAGDRFASRRRTLPSGVDYDVGAVDTRPRPRERERVFYPDHGERVAHYPVDREKEILKQRMIRPTLSANSVFDQRRHHRARSLSLSRPSSQESVTSYESARDQRLNHRMPAKYQKQQQLSLVSSQSALAPWPHARSPDRNLLRDQESLVRRDGYARGYVVERPSHSMEPRLRMSPFYDDTRLPNAFQAMSLGPDMRTLSTRSASFDAKSSLGLARKGMSQSPGRMEHFEPPAIKRRPLYPIYREVHVLILTWKFHDLRTAPYTAPPSADYVSLEDETKRLHETFGSFGYKVQDWSIPMERPVEKMRNRLKKFCRQAADDVLLIVYYHGHGSLDDENELVFSSHEHPSNLDWCQAAAAELYAAMLSGDSCPSHGREKNYHELLKKYERYRPVAEVKWDDIREIVLGSPCDLLLILDCCAAGGASLRHVNWQPQKSAEGYTKHLFAACGFESSTSDDMTAAMCDVLDEWVPGQPIHRDHHHLKNPRTVSPGAQAPFLTTKRLHQIMEDKLQKDSVGSQPIFKQLLPHDPEQYITLPNLLDVERRGRRRGYYVDVD